MSADDPEAGSLANGEAVSEGAEQDPGHIAQGACSLERQRPGLIRFCFGSSTRRDMPGLLMARTSRLDTFSEASGGREGVWE